MYLSTIYIDVLYLYFIHFLKKKNSTFYSLQFYVNFYVRTCHLFTGCAISEKCIFRITERVSIIHLNYLAVK